MERVIVKNYCNNDLTPVIIQELPKAIHAIIDSEIQRGITLKLSNGQEIYIKRKGENDIVFTIHQLKKSLWTKLGFIKTIKTDNPGIMSLNISVK